MVHFECLGANKAGFNHFINTIKLKLLLFTAGASNPATSLQSLGPTQMNTPESGNQGLQDF